jgi:hypothetical protein
MSTQSVDGALKHNYKNKIKVKYIKTKFIILKQALIIPQTFSLILFSTPYT